MSKLFRSFLFVPGNNPRFLEKTKKLSVDIVCFDLEDSVPNSEKKNARKLIKESLKNSSEYSADVYVRTNSPYSGKISDDLKEIVQKGIDGIVIPKVSKAKELKKIEKILSKLEKKRKLRPVELIPSIESAQGVENSYEIASSSKRTSALVFGVFDLLNDMGIDYTKNAEGAKYARAKIPLAARAAGVYALDAIWQDLNDQNGFEEDCQIAKNLGYVGKTLIHPDQIPTTHKIFHPTKTEIEWAQKVYDSYLKSAKKGKGATAVEGKMIDEVHYKHARAVLDLVRN